MHLPIIHSSESIKVGEMKKKTSLKSFFVFVCLKECFLIVYLYVHILCRLLAMTSAVVPLFGLSSSGLLGCCNKELLD